MNVAHFLPIIKINDNKYYIQLSDNRFEISSNQFENLKRRRYIIYLESLGEWVFYFPKDENIYEKNNRRVGFSIDYETEYVVYLYEKEKKLYSLEYRERLVGAIGNDITFVPCDLTELVFNCKWLNSVEKNSMSQSQIGIGKIKLAELWKLNKDDTEIIKKAKEQWYQNHDVVIKLNFPSKSDNSGQIERIIYQNFILKMLRLGQTAHVMIPLFSYECKNFTSSYLTKNALTGNVLEWYKTLPSDYYDKSTLLVTVLEKGKGFRFREWIENPHGLLSWKTVLFQLIWTITVFGEYGLVHNDLHKDNIFIEPLENPIWCIYFINTRDYFIMPINYFVKIYDFDRSTVVANKKLFPGALATIKKAYIPTFESKLYKEKRQTKTTFSNIDTHYMNTKDFKNKYRHFKIELFEEKDGDKLTLENTVLDDNFCIYGQCNRFDPFIDVFYVFWEVYHSKAWEKDIIPDETKQWILEPFYGSEMLLNQTYGHRGIICKTKVVYNKKDKQSEKQCIGPYPINTKKDMMDTKTMLMNLFPEFKQSLPYFDPSFNLENSYPHLYVLPSVQVDNPNFLDRLDSTKIKPISFKQLKF